MITEVRIRTGTGHSVRVPARELPDWADDDESFVVDWHIAAGHNLGGTYRFRADREPMTIAEFIHHHNFTTEESDQ